MTRRKGILLDRYGDLFGLKTKEIFMHHSPNFNWVNLTLKDVWAELKTSEHDTEFHFIIPDDIEQLEKLAFWSGQLNKDAKKHIKKLKKKARAKEKK